jgi:hypothetical protein
MFGIVGKLHNKKRDTPLKDTIQNSLKIKKQKQKGTTKNHYRKSSTMDYLTTIRISWFFPLKNSHFRAYKYYKIQKR